MTVRLTKAGVARYTYDSPDGHWVIEMFAWPPREAPAWFRPGYYWHAWSPIDPDSRLRTKPVESFTTLTKARQWLTEKYKENTNGSTHT